MRFLRQSLTGLFLAALTLGLLGYAVHSVRSAIATRMAEESFSPPARERVFAVGVVTAQSDDVAPVLNVFGEIASRRTLELRAAGSGRVVWLADAFEDGGRVAAGDVLMRIDPADAEAALERVRVDLTDAEAELADAERTLLLSRDEAAAAEEQADLRETAFQRQRDLAGRGVGTAAAVETAELAAASARQSVLSRRQAVAQAEKRVDQARTNLARARIALAEAERDLQDVTITAPFAGTLKATSVVEGRLVNVNEKLAELIDPDALEVAFRVSTAQYTRLIDETGQLRAADVVARLDVSGVDLTAKGTVNRTALDAEGTQTGRRLFARLDGARGFQPGDFVTVSVAEPVVRNVVTLPAAALDPNGSVLVVDEGERLERIPVDLVRRQGNLVLVRGEGLEGREVVEALSPLLGEGIRVRPIRRGAAPEAPSMVELTEERRAKLVAFVEANQRMPQDVKARVLARLAEQQVPEEMVNRLESRMGG